MGSSGMENWRLFTRLFQNKNESVHAFATRVEKSVSSIELSCEKDKSVIATYQILIGLICNQVKNVALSNNWTLTDFLSYQDVEGEENVREEPIVKLEELEYHDTNYKKDTDQDVKFYQCKGCEQEFKCEETLACHQLTTYECNKCMMTDQSQSFLCQDSFNFHMKSIHDIIMVKCKHCDLSTCEEETQFHFDEFHKNDMDICDFCGEAFLKGAIFENHMKRRCDICRLCFNNQNKASKHITEIHKKAKPIFPWHGVVVNCNICNREFASYRLLYNHRAIIHEKDKHQFHCHICALTFITQNKLDVHLRTHETDDSIKNPYRCKVCGKGFPTNNWMENHVNTVHKKMSRFICHLCSKEFYYKKDLNHHILRVHEKIKNVECTYCGLKIFGEYELNKHIRLTHLKIKDFKCDVCGKAFARKNMVTLHKKSVHSHEKDFKCHLCGKAYLTNYQLTKHIKDFHEQVKRPCNICGKTISGYELTNMKHHQINMHKEYTYKEEMSKLNLSR